MFFRFPEKMAAPMEVCFRNLCILRLRSQWLTLNRKRTSSNNQSDFSLLLRKRYNQAKRSVMVRTQNPEGTLTSLQNNDRLNSAFFTSSDQGYILAEFENSSGVQRLLKNINYFQTSTQFPLYSRCVCDVTQGARHSSHRRGNSVKIQHFPSRLSEEYPALGSLEAELVHLLKQRSLSDIDHRMRHMMCMMVEDVVKSLSPEIRVVPFGSCMNGFGWWDSDLDMMLCFHDDPFHVEPQGNQDSRFKFLTEVFRTERHLALHTLSALAALIDIMPRTARVQKILHARIPIIRFHHLIMSLDCDISLQAVDSIRMTELLYLLSQFEVRLKLLMTCIKEWAVRNDQTSSGEKQKPTTLGLLFLLIFFFQTRSPPVLPTLRQLQSYAGSSNMFVIEGVKYHLPTSHKRIPPSMNTESVESLLFGFFDFFSKFDFETQGISIADGIAFPKTVASSPLLIENPLGLGLNICRNVSLKNVQILQEEMGEAAHALQTFQEKGNYQDSWLSSIMSAHPDEDNLNIKVESLLSGFSESGEREATDHGAMSDIDSDNVDPSLSKYEHDK